MSIAQGAAAIEPLLALLKDAEDGVRKRAANALGRIGDKRAIDPVRAAAAQEKVPDVHKAMVDALEAMGSKE